jgi:predicted Fe-S protein YdhL (DUF1289 family)
MHRVFLEDLKEVSRHRPEGYMDDVLAYGKQVLNWVELSDENYQHLVQKYSPDRAKQGLGPGSLLAVIIHQIAGKVPKDCMACNARVRKMNVWGWLGCWRHRHEIVQWLIEEAEKLGHKIDGKIVVGLLRAAIKEHFKRV